jgi:hypothetical protein
MNHYLLSAGVLMFVLAAAHSVLGERLIFRHVRAGTPGHEAATALLPQRRWDSLWSTWHLLSLIGLGLSAAMVAASTFDDLTQAVDIVAIILAVTFAVSGVFWFAGTKGKHPAWIVLFAIAGLIYSAR